MDMLLECLDDKRIDISTQLSRKHLSYLADEELRRATMKLSQI